MRVSLSLPGKLACACGKVLLEVGRSTTAPAPLVSAMYAHPSANSAAPRPLQQQLELLTDALRQRMELLHDSGRDTDDQGKELVDCFLLNLSPKRSALMYM